MSASRGRVLPIYLVADESGSMRPAVDDLNAGITLLQRALFVEPMAAAKVRLSIMGFADRVTLHVRLADMREPDTLPKLAARGGTRYGVVFAELLRVVSADVVSLQAAGYGVHRPTVFFLSDGRPTDKGWQHAHRRLVDRAAFRAAPNVIACGIGAADPDTILAVATEPSYAFVSVPGAELSTQIASFCAGLTHTVVVTGRLLAVGKPAVVIPQPAGFQLVLDVI